MGCTPSLPGTEEPLPQAPYNLFTNVNSETSIEVGGTYGDYTPSIASNRANTIYYKKSSDSNWTDSGNNFDGTGGFGVTLNGLEPGTQYDIMSVVWIDKGYYAVSDVVTGRTARPGFTLISDCQQLQDIQLHLGDKYELGNDIDCSDTINWNDGAGFDPIGYVAFDFSQSEYFTGVFAGNNYTISDLYIDTTDNSIGNALFIGANNARLQDLKLLRMVQISDSIALGGGLVAYAANSSITNIQVTQGDASGAFDVYGGVVGSIGIFAPGDYDLTKSSYDGSVLLYGTTDVSGIQESYGGIVGQISINSPDTSVKLENNYAINNLDDTSGVVARGGVVGFTLIPSEATSSSIQVRNSYASGSMRFADSYPIQSVAGGIVGVSVGIGLSMQDSFSHLDLTDASYSDIGWGGAIGVNVDEIGGPINLDFDNTYFDADRAGTVSCDVYGWDTCNSVTSNPTYFYNNISNLPLNTWDFTNIWQTTSTLPVFGASVTNSVSIIPEQFLNSGGGQGGGGSQPSSSDNGQQSSIKKYFASTGSEGDKGEKPSLFQQIANKIRDFVRNLPESVVRSFPFMLMGLTTLGIIFMILETKRQSQKFRILTGLITKQRSLAQQRDTFWHLAANYLRAPVTLLVGGVELLQIDKKKLAVTDRLTKLIKGMQTKVAAIMEDIESSETLKGIAWPDDAPTQVLRTFGFWVTILILTGFLTLANYIIFGFRNLEVSTLTLLTQAVAFGLIVYVIYWAFGGLHSMRQKVKNAEALMARQTSALQSARSKLMNQSVDMLDSDIDSLQKSLNDIPSKHGARVALQEGSTRLRTMLDSFQLLGAAETGQLAALSPAGAHSNVDSLIEQIVSREQSAINAKKVSLDLPAMTKLSVPGAPKLTQQVIGTVLDNAIAFSPSGGSVNVEILTKPGYRGLAIHDHGQGVEKEQLAHMFEPFTKADGDDALRMNHEGLGIDLYLNKLIMEHLGGTISATSSAGRGTTVKLLWPA